MNTAQKNRILLAVSDLYKLDVKPWLQLIASEDIDSKEAFEKEFKDYCKELRNVTRVRATNEEIRGVLREESLLKFF